MSEITTAAFLSKGTPEQFSVVLGLYSEALRLKAEAKSKKPEELIRLDEWYQNKLPSLIKSRSDPHITHEELVNVTKWKLARGKFRPRLKELVTMNSPRLVMAESKKAFRALFKKEDLNVAIAYLSNLKGIGPSTASAILTAGAPHLAAFMADECLAAVPEIEGIDYTVQEYMDLMKALKQASNRLSTTTNSWSVHRIELALWTHNVLLLHKPDMLTVLNDLPPTVAPAESEDSEDTPIISALPIPTMDDTSNSALEAEEEFTANGVVIPIQNGNGKIHGHGHSSDTMTDEESRDVDAALGVLAAVAAAAEEHQNEETRDPPGGLEVLENSSAIVEEEVESRDSVAAAENGEDEVPREAENNDDDDDGPTSKKPRLD